MSVSVRDWKRLIKPKYGNVRNTTDGLRFDSKLEARHYAVLKNLWADGKIQWFIRQCPFQLPGGAVYRADFLVLPMDGPPEIDECKGYMTAIASLKIRQVTSIYGIKINIIRKVRT